MALKGFLASGFQKLIGASRIKGADDTFLGENNEQELTANTFPIALDLAPGFNIINYTLNAVFEYPDASTRLFNTNPTIPTEVTFINKSSNSSKMIFNSAATSGGLVLHSGPFVSNVGGAITFFYDITLGRWREKCRTGLDSKVLTQTITATGGLSFTGDEAERIFILDAAAGATFNITGISPYGLYTPAGRRCTIIGSQSLSDTTLLTVKAATTMTGTDSDLYINGDFVLGRGAQISLLQMGDGWIEISRTTLSY